jgi:hypothetical protein
VLEAGVTLEGFGTLARPAEVGASSPAASPPVRCSASRERHGRPRSASPASWRGRARA